MPIYDFNCSSCQKHYEEFVRAYNSDGDYPEVKCPVCGSFEKKKTPSMTAPPAFVQKEGTSRMERFGYRAGHNMEKAKDLRRTAEAASHMGTSPYETLKGDDFNVGDPFGPVQ